jgi:hypothetical protein
LFFAFENPGKTGLESRMGFGLFYCREMACEEVGRGLGALMKLDVSTIDVVIPERMD